jgi:dTMP kinase
MFVVIEGIDGSGKGTITKELQARLGQKMITRSISFPRYAETLYGQLIGRYLNGEFGTDTHPYLHGTLYAIDRFELRPYLQEMIRTADIVFSDRYIPSNLCYSAMKATPEERDAVVRHFVELEYDIFKMPVPDVIVFLDMPTKFAVQNIAKKAVRDYTDKPADLHEADESYLEQVRTFYASRLMEFHPATRFVVIPCVADGELLPIDVIVTQIMVELISVAEGV